MKIKEQFIDKALIEKIRKNFQKTVIAMKL